MRFLKGFICLWFLPLLGQELSPEALEKERLALLAKLKEAHFYIDQKKYSLAHDKYKLILNQYPDNLEAHIGIISAYGSEQKKVDLKTYAEQTLSKSKDGSLESLTINAVTKIWARDMEAAVTDLTKATKRFPETAYMAQYYLGYLKFRKRKHDSALPFLLEAVRINPDYTAAYYLLGDIYYRKKDKPKMVKYWNEFLKRTPKQGDRYLRVNQIFKQHGG